MVTGKINCWQYKRCGREPGGAKARTEGVCPAAASQRLDTFNNGLNAGRCCWLVAGTFCDQQVMGTFAEKIDSCRNCSFYKKVQEEEHSFAQKDREIAFAAATHIGYVKENNEDRYYCRRLEDGVMLFAVADGLGGQAAGDYAAEILRGRLAGIKVLPQGREEEILTALALDTDRLIVAAGEEDQRLEGMGTTLLCAVVRDDRLHWVHVGDSRLSVFRSGELLQLTQDQNLARYLVEEGEITPEEVADHYSRNILDQALGSILDSPETGSLELVHGDTLLLSTDGFHNLVTPDSIVHILEEGDDLEKATAALVDAALNRGGMDNITLVLVRYTPDSPATAP